MSLATRCPQCNTLFKVTSGQLQVHGGQVRCGHCKHVFSGIEHLTSADTEVWETVRIQGDHIADGVVHQADGQSVDTALAQQISFGTEAEAGPSFLTATDTKHSRARQYLNIFLVQYQALPALWRMGLLSLLAMACLQSLWLLRKPAVNALGWPSFESSGPYLLRAFSIAPSGVLLIEGSGLKAMDEHTLQVEVTLHNPARLPSLWPVLKVDLLDSQGLPLASKNLRPSEYQVLVGQTTQVAENAKPIGPKSTIEVQAYLNLKALHQQLPEAAATGFRLALFDSL